MKKMYIIPETEIEIMTEKETILAGSPDGFNNTLNEDAGQNGNAALSREIDEFFED